MEEEQKLKMINEIKRIERELYLKRSHLAAAKAMEQDASAREGLDFSTDVSVGNRLLFLVTLRNWR